ncbi:MAG: class I SAM-dependent methyltransferase [Vampirovibrionia bacterium]
MTITDKPTTQDVYNFWNNNFLYSFEFDIEPGTKEFFEAVDSLKKNDIEKFSYNLWEFEKHQNKKVLDIGCGPGWLVVNFAKNNADIYAVDITDTAVDITSKTLQLLGLSANLHVANAEQLPFEDNYFDFITSSGVLHHTPDTQKAVDEVYRVLKPGGRAIISLYYRNFLLTPAFFPLMLKVYNFFSPRVPDRNKMMVADSPEEFVRMYDGEQNPVGSMYDRKETIKLFNKFEIKGIEIHFFPKRFFNAFKNIDGFLYKILDKYFGTMIFVQLYKKP